MRAWSAPDVPALSDSGPAVRIHDTATGKLVETRPEGPARLYVCGITPYDATHIGHAATYVAFDLLNRAWRDAGHEVSYVQNVTDVDDPLLERAAKVDIDWVALAERETELFREDMEALRVLPPAHYVGAVESIPLVIALIQRLEQTGSIYRVDDDLYFSVSRRPAVRRDLPHGPRRDAQRLRRARRRPRPRGQAATRSTACSGAPSGPGEPSWDSPFGPGRPGWHIECTAIALEYLGEAFDVQGGGSDLVFPHHEMSAGEAQVASGADFAQIYAHAGMVGYDGEKMSKSQGNLVFVSALRNSDIDPMAIRLALLRHHYRADWEWTDDALLDAVDTLDRWRSALASAPAHRPHPWSSAVTAALADDLDAPTAVAVVEAWVDATWAPRARRHLRRRCRGRRTRAARRSLGLAL